MRRSPQPVRMRMARRIEIGGEVAVSFLRLVYEPSDWVAVFLKSYKHVAEWLNVSDLFRGPRRNGFSAGSLRWTPINSRLCER